MHIPLCVDLDGTLIKTDALFESFLLLIKRNPLYFFTCIIWLLRGRPYLKQKILERVELDAKHLPYSQQFLNYLKEQHRLGREIVLVTASDKKIAEQIANELKIFTEVIASDGKHNIKGKTKRDRLNERFGKKQYDYAGNSSPDLKVWADARHAIAVNTSSSLLKKAQANGNVDNIFHERKATLKTFLKAIRVHQYAKNTLVFIPLLAGHLYFNLPLILDAVLAFIAFNLLASSVYILNDLLDLQADRQHHSKKHRAFAAGDFSISFGLMLIPLFMIPAFVIATFLPKYFILVLLGYFVATLLYSFHIKKQLLLDVFLLAILYTVRIIAGMVAINASYSQWLISFSVFFFLSLAFVKRYTELYFAKQKNETKLNSRSYHIDDLTQLSLFGVVSGYLSTVIFALYLNSSNVVTLYKHPQILWLACIFLLYWISRIWMLATRGLIDEDPVLFAVKDKVSFAVIFAIAIVAICATF